MRSTSAAALLALLAACGPATGAPDAGGACGGPSRTPANLIENPGFECDSGEWSAVSGYGTVDLVAGGRTGRAGQVTVEALGGRLLYGKDFAPNPGTKTFCFTAWLSGTVPFMRMRVLRELPGGVQEVQFSEQVTSDWRRIPTLQVDAQSAPKLVLVFEVQTNRTDGQNGQPGQVLRIDDVDVWESTTRCMESR